MTDKMGNPHGYVVLAVLPNPVEANMLKAQLDTEGIRCAIENENMGDVFIGNVAQGVKVLIHEEDLQRAKLIMDVVVELPEDMEESKE